MAQRGLLQRSQGYGWTAPTRRAGRAAGRRVEGHRTLGLRPPLRSKATSTSSSPLLRLTSRHSLRQRSVRAPCKVASVATCHRVPWSCRQPRHPQLAQPGRRAKSQTGKAPQQKHSGRGAPTGRTVGEAGHTLTGHCPASQPGPTGGTKHHRPLHYKLRLLALLRKGF